MCSSMYVRGPEQAHPETGSGLVVARGWGREWGCLPMGMGFLFRVMKMFLSKIEVMAHITVNVVNATEYNVSMNICML